MRLLLPFPIETVRQRFGENRLANYARLGLKGHPAWDFFVPWDTPVRASVGGLVYRVDKSDQDRTLSRTIFTLVQDGADFYSVHYGHFDDIYVKEGQHVRIGDIIGTVGNAGVNYDANRQVIPHDIGLGQGNDWAHLHGPEVAPLDRAVTRGNEGYYLQSSTGYYFDGSYYRYRFFDNGYQGAIDPAPFFFAL